MKEKVTTAVDGTVSVVVPAHNDADYIRECVDSVMSQSLAPLEIIICDDASTDGTRDIIADLQLASPMLIRSVLHDENVGCARNFNSGIEASRGRYITLVAADDVWSPKKLEQELGALASSGCCWAYSAVELYWQDGPHQGQRTAFWGTETAHPGDLFEDILRRNISPRNFLIERQTLVEAGGFDEDFGMYEDWDLKIRLAARYPAAFVPQTGVTYRQHTQGISRGTVDRQLSEATRVLRKNAQLIRDRFPENAQAVIDAACSRLVPGADASAEKCSINHTYGLALTYVPRRLSRRGSGLIFLMGDACPPACQRLMQHPDVYCIAEKSGIPELWGIATNHRQDAHSLEWLAAGLFADYRRKLYQSGKSRILQLHVATPRTLELLQKVFPESCIVVAQSYLDQWPDSAGSVNRRLVVIGNENDANAPEDAYVALCKALELPPSGSLPRAELRGEPAGELLCEGERLFENGDLEGAEKCFLNALSYNARLPELCNNLAVVYWQKGDAGLALDYLVKGLAVDADHAELLMNGVKIFLEMSRLPEARDLYRRYRERNPGNADIERVLGSSGRRAG